MARSFRRLHAVGHLVREDVLAAVVPDRVKPPSCVEAAAQVAVCEDDSLLVIERSADHLAPRGLDHRRAAATEHLLIGREWHRKLVWERGGGNELRTDTTNAPDSIAMWRIDASQPSTSSAVGATQICGPPR